MKMKKLIPAGLALLLFCSIPAGAAGTKKGSKKVQDVKHFTFKWFQDLEPVWYEETSGVFEKALKNDLADVKEVVFASRANGRDWHWYANFGYRIDRENSFYYGGCGGRLSALNLHTKELRTIFEDLEGDIRDPAVSYDAKKVLFSYRKGGTHQFHLYIINADGTGLEQITDGKYDDFEPCWLPDGGIMFVSSRCMRWVPCWYAQVGIMYRCEADGSNLHPVSFGVETENTPWPMNNGRVLYTRWEYVDRSQNDYHGLWTINPDGTSVALFYDNLGTMNLYIDAKPIPGSEKICTIVSPKHGRNEHRGRIGILDPAYGSDSEEAIRFLDSGYPSKTAEKKKGHVGEESWRDPYPVSANCFLVASKRHLAVMNGKGDYEFIFELPKTDHTNWNLHEPRPLIPRSREPVIPHVKPSEDGMATLMLMDVTIGRNMKGIEYGDVKHLLIMEELPRPAANCAYADAISSGSNYVLHRVLGKVPVEDDGSANFRVPAGRAIFFYALDKDGLSVKAMPSYLSTMPGEVTSCVGCHEKKTRTTGLKTKSLVSEAMKRPPSEIEPVKGVPEIFDYVRDIQPIWDKHCIKCHNYEKHAGDLILTGDMTASWSVSYHELKKVRKDKRGRFRYVNCGPGYEPDPYKTASGGSILIKTLMKGHKNVELSELELEKIKRWADAGTTFAGTYASLGSVSRNNKIELEKKKDPEYTKRLEPIRETLEKRCDICHQSKGSKNHWLEGENRKEAYRYNMSKPEKSLILLAPLAKSAGGLELCGKDKKSPADAPDGPVFKSTEDSAYKVLRGFVDVIKEQYGQPRWFEQEFRPKSWYIREMKRFGALPDDFDPEKNKVDWHRVDRDYFRNIYRKCPGPQPGD